MNVFTKITIKTLRKNKTRTLVTIIGIVLATAMLTAVTTFISSLQSYMVRAVIAQMGNWHGVVYELSGEQVRQMEGDGKMEETAAVQEVGFAVLPGATEESWLSRRAPYLFVMGMTDEAGEMLPIRLSKGRMPENEGELVVTSMAIATGRADIELGDTLTLEIGKRMSTGREPEELLLYNPLLMVTEDGDMDLEVGEKLVPQETRTYKVVGFMDTPGFVDSNSASYCAVTAADEKPEEDSRFACFYRCRRSPDVYETAERYMEGGSYATYNSELLRYQGVSLNRPFMRMLYGLAAILIFLIMTGGISLVYNSFAISVSDRTRQFGLLASTGATPKQLRGMVLREALLVSAVGIPLGILSGIVGIGITLHFTGRAFSYLYASASEVLHLSVSWPAVAVAAVTALVTVLISAWIPSRRAARISPMDAIRQTGDIKVPKRIARKGKLSYRLFGLEGMIAGKHFSRNKRQYRTTIFSLFISIVLFISASSFSSYVKSSIRTVNDISENDISVYIEEEKEGEMEEIRERVRAVEGVDHMLSVGCINMDLPIDPELVSEDYRAFLEAQDGRTDETGWGGLYREDGKLMLYDSRILVLEDEAYEAYVEELGLPKEEYLGAEADKVIALNQVKGYISQQQRFRLYDIMKAPGAEVEMLMTDYDAWNEAERAAGRNLPRGDFQKPCSVTVGTFAGRAPMNLYGEWGGGFSVFLSESMLSRLGGGENPYFRTVQLYIQAENHRATAERLEELTLDGSYESYFFVMNEAETRETHRSLLLTVDVFTFGFITLISLIAVANVFNTISTGVLLRRKEFAVLSSVGMTPKGLRRMLNYECVLYGCKALLYGLPASMLITWRIYEVVARSMDTGFYVPMASIVIAVLSVFLVVFATMLYARSRMEGENIMDSIRQESL